VFALRHKLEINEVSCMACHSGPLQVLRLADVLQPCPQLLPLIAKSFRGIDGKQLVGLENALGRAPFAMNRAACCSSPSPRRRIARD